ncbi:cyclic nucleotide-binding-like protein [Obelidium mucronatum]|nr:cyclic nucleotide-binding-like protein [Obelidium mucronatum]
MKNANSPAVFVADTYSEGGGAADQQEETWIQKLLFSSAKLGAATSYDILCDERGTSSIFSSGIHIHSPFASILNLAIIVAYFVSIFFIPYHAAYKNQSGSFQSNLAWGISAMLVLDSLLNFFTPPLEPIKSSQHYRSPRKLSQWQRYYIKHYILIDLITMVPWPELIQNELLYFPLSLLIIFRVIRLPSMMSQNTFCESIAIEIRNIAGIGTILTRIMSIGAVLIMFIHVQACVLYFMGKVQDFVGWDTQFSHWAVFPGGIRAATNVDRHIWMISQAIGNILQLTFKPETNSEQIITFVFIAFGAILYATIVGLISSAAISFDAPGKLYRQRIDELKEYLTWKEIDKSTKKKLLQYYEFKYRGKYFEELSLLGDLNESLRREVASFNCKRLLEKVPFLKRNMGDGRDDLFLGKLASALLPSFFIPGDFIFHQGEKSSEMFFVLSGTLQVIVNGSVVAQCEDGMFFGEVALIANIPRTATVKAMTQCKLYSLSSKDFNEIILEFQDIRERIDFIYEERMKRIRIEQATLSRTNHSTN